MNYKFLPDVRSIVKDSGIVLRRGIWNFFDGYLEWGSIKKNDVESVKQIFLDLIEGKDVSYPIFKNFHVETQNIFNQLIENKFIVAVSNSNAVDPYQMYTRLDYSKPENKTFFLISSNEDVKNIILNIANKNEHKIILCSDEEQNFLKNVSIDRMNASRYEKNIIKIKSIIKDIPIIVIDESISITMLRGLNRSLNNNTPLFLGFLDGPFMIYLSIVGGEGGCFECYEQRMLARLQDHVLYHEFVKKAPCSYNSKSPATIAAMSFLIHQAYSDLYSYSVTGKSQFASRILHIYLPTFEIQYHDNLKMPSCPLCGHFSSNSNTIGEISLRNLLLESGGIS